MEMQSFEIHRVHSPYTYGDELVVKAVVSPVVSPSASLEDLRAAGPFNGAPPMTGVPISDSNMSLASVYSTNSLSSLIDEGLQARRKRNNFSPTTPMTATAAGPSSGPPAPPAPFSLPNSPMMNHYSATRMAMPNPKPTSAPEAQTAQFWMPPPPPPPPPALLPFLISIGAAVAPPLQRVPPSPMMQPQSYPPTSPPPPCFPNSQSGDFAYNPTFMSQSPAAGSYVPMPTPMTVPGQGGSDALFPNSVSMDFNEVMRSTSPPTAAAPNGPMDESEAPSVAAAGTPAPPSPTSPPLDAPSCDHVARWKKLRVKKGVGHFLCTACGCRWRAQTAAMAARRQLLM